MTAGTPLRITPSRSGSTKVLALTGELDLATRDTVIDAVTTALDDPTVEDLRLDLSALAFIDCSGISALVVARQLADEKGIPVTLCNARGMPRRILRMTELVDNEVGAESGEAG